MPAPVIFSMVLLHPGGMAEIRSRSEIPLTQKKLMRPWTKNTALPAVADPKSKLKQDVEDIFNPGLLTASCLISLLTPLSEPQPLSRKNAEPPTTR